MSSFSHQQWDSVILSKKTKTNKSHTRSEKKSIGIFDPEQQTKNTVSNKTLSSAIRKARSEKKLSQTAVDKACNFPKNTVRDYENCKAVINPNQLNKLNSFFGVKLPRPKKTKA